MATWGLSHIHVEAIERWSLVWTDMSHTSGESSEIPQAGETIQICGVDAPLEAVFCIDTKISRRAPPPLGEKLSTRRKSELAVVMWDSP